MTLLMSREQFIRRKTTFPVLILADLVNKDTCLTDFFLFSDKNLEVRRHDSMTHTIPATEPQTNVVFLKRKKEKKNATVFIFLHSDF